MNEAAAPRPNRSLQEKSAARMAAAQLLYKASLMGESLKPETLASEYKDYIGADEDETIADAVAPNTAFLKKLLQGIADHGEALEPWVDKALGTEWKKDRVSPLLLAVLRLAIFELAHWRDLKPAIIINEYVNVTAHFFGDAETGFVNAALNRLSTELRG